MMSIKPKIKLVYLTLPGDYPESIMYALPVTIHATISYLDNASYAFYKEWFRTNNYGNIATDSKACYIKIGIRRN